MSSRGARHRLLRAAAVAVLCVPGVPRALRAQQDTGVVDLLMQVRVERGPNAVLAGFARDSLVLLPMRALFDLAGVVATAGREGTRYVAAVRASQRPVVLDLAGGRIVRGDSVLALAPGDWLIRDGEPFVDAHALAWALGVGDQLSWPDLTFFLVGTDSLPVVAHAVREARRNALLQEPAPPPQPWGVAVPRRSVDGAVLDWSLTTSTTNPADASVLALGFGGQLFGGSLEISQQVRSYEQTFDRTRATWTGVWPGRARLQQMRIGDIVAAGPDPRTVRGGLITNAPYVRQAIFGTDAFAGRVPPGWEAELYRSSRIVAYSGPQQDQRFVLETPVSYGQNPLDLVLYGPHGEVVHRSLTIFVPSERLPAGRFEYALGGGACQDDPTCGSAANADLRYGLSRRVTAEAGVQVQSAADRKGRAYPYGLVSFGLTPAVGLTLHGALHGLLRARADVDPSPDVHLSLEQGWFDTTATAQYAGRAPGRSRTALNVFWRPSLLGGALFVTGDWTTALNDTTRSDIGALAVTVAAFGARASVGLHRIATTARGGPTFSTSGLDASLQTVLRGPGRVFRGMFVRGSLVTTCPGELTTCTHEITNAGLSVGQQLLHAFRLDVGARWQKGWSRPGYDVGITTTLPYLRAQSRNSWDPAFGVGGSESVEGSVRWNRARRQVEFGDGRSLGRAGLTGVVFFDENGNSVRDPGEPGLPEVLLRVGSHAVATDSLGRFRVFDFVPFESTVIEVDSLTLRNPLWLPVEPRLNVAPTPNSYQEVDIPVLQAAEVTGRVTWAGHENALAGLRVVFRNQANGQEAATTTFSDGGFDVVGIRPGTYWAFVDLAQMDQLHATSEPLSVTVARGGSGQVEGVTLRIEFAAQR